MEFVLGELICDKTRLKKQAQLDTKFNLVESVFLASCGRYQSKQRHGNKEDIRCRQCNELGDVQSHY